MFDFFRWWQVLLKRFGDFELIVCIILLHSNCVCLLLLTLSISAPPPPHIECYLLSLINSMFWFYWNILFLIRVNKFFYKNYGNTCIHVVVKEFIRDWIDCLVLFDFCVDTIVLLYTPTRNWKNKTKHRINQTKNQNKTTKKKKMTPNQPIDWSTVRKVIHIACT